jgi:hypothetical protein
MNELAAIRSLPTRNAKPPAESGSALPVGFYKRGCQVKTLLLSREEGMFFGHPAQFAAPRTLSGARLASANASDICGIMFFAFFRAASLRH